MGRSRKTQSRCRIPIRTHRISSPPMKHSASTPSRQRRNSHSPPSPLRKSNSGRYTNRAPDNPNYKQPSTRSIQQQPLEGSYLPPRGSSRQPNSNYEKDLASFGTTVRSNNENENINSMFSRRPEHDALISRSERLGVRGSYRIIDAAKNTAPNNTGFEYGVSKSWETTGMANDNSGKDTTNPLLRSQLPSPSQAPIVYGTSTSSRRNISRSEDLDRILTKYAKTPSKTNVNSDKDHPDFASVVRTNTTTFRMTSCKLGMNQAPGIQGYWGEDQHNHQKQKQEENDILLKLNNAVRCRTIPTMEHLHEDLERTVQLPGPDGPVTAPMHPIDKELKVYHVTHKDNNQNQLLRRSTHVFPFKETPCGHLVVDPVQIAFESRKISVLVSDPTSNTATVEFTTTKYGTNDEIRIPFQPTNKNERILHEVKKAMSIQETHENNGIEGNSMPRLHFHPQSEEINKEKYSDSKKATVEFEDNLLKRVVSGKNADTHVIIGDKIFPCHSLALELFSTYFERLNRPPETIQRVQLPETEVAVTAFPILMDWIVQSEEGRREILTKENLVSVYAAARHLTMKDLELQCITFLERKVDSTDPDLLTMWDDVKRRQSTCSELVRIIASKMSASYHCIYKSKRYLQMEADELFMLLNSDDISIDSEMDVYDSAVTWLLQDWKNRKADTNKIMSTVRFGLLSPLQLTQINLCPEINKVKNEKDYNQIITYGSVKSMIDDGLAFSILDESYKNQPEELKKWMDKTGVKAPNFRTCLVNRKRASPMILEKISLLEDASQTKLLSNFNKLPEKSSSYTLLDTPPKPGTPYIENLTGSAASPSNTSTDAEYFGNRGNSRIPKPPGVVGSVGAVNSGSFSYGQNTSNNNSSIYHAEHEPSLIVHELSKPILLSNNSSNTLQQAVNRSETDRSIAKSEADAAADRYSTSERYEQYNSTK